MLAPRLHFTELGDIELTSETATRLLAARKLFHCVTEANEPAPIEIKCRPCMPVDPDSLDHQGGAMLVGLSSVSFDWDADDYVATYFDESEANTGRALRSLAAEFGEEGINDSFKSLVLGTSTVIGCASERTQRMNAALSLETVPIGGPIGSIDCHIGGNPVLCSEKAAYIRYCPTSSGDFQLCALSDNDLVTINGKRITPDMGCFPLLNDDVVTVGPRVFVFLLPSDT